MPVALAPIERSSSRVLDGHVQSVRLFMRDFPYLNLLIRGEESSDRMIEWATMDFLSDFNGTTPFSGHSLDSLFALNLQALCLRGTVISLLQSLMIFYARNHLPFSDGNLTVAINDKAPLIMNMISMFQSAYEQNKRMVKTALNVQELLDSGPSGVHSDYYALSTLGYY